MEQKTVFISRTLSEQSPIRTLLEAEKKTFHDESLIDFSPILFELPKTEWLFFYSKSGVKFFFEQYPLAVHKNFKIGCFGPSTASYCKEHHKVTFHGNSEKETCLKLIQEHVEENDITFICGRHSLRSVQSLSEQVFQETIVYDHSIRERRALGSYHIAILTSPMNVASFIRNEGHADKYISIGSTTAETMVKSNLSPLIAPYPSEEGIAQLLKEHLH